MPLSKVNELLNNLLSFNDWYIIDILWNDYHQKFVDTVDLFTKLMEIMEPIR